MLGRLPTVAPDSHFPLQNLPYGVFSTPQIGSAGASSSGRAGQHRIGVALGDSVVDLHCLHDRGIFAGSAALQGSQCFKKASLREFMQLGRQAWTEARAILTLRLGGALSESGPSSDDVAAACYPLAEVSMHLPVEIGDYTDFYASREHATNVGCMFRDPKNALNPNWCHLPVGYHGRTSSIVVSGSPVRRPCGQLMAEGATQPVLAASRVLDFELEMACLMGPGNALGEPISVDSAKEHIFGLVLMNDWSARDIQKWEYVPLGPFNGKNWATTISAWVVTLDALEPFRCPAPAQDPAVLPYLQETDRKSYDVRLEACIRPRGSGMDSVVSRSSLRHLYWTFPQMVAHHTVGGCNLRPGDMLGTGTISSPEPGGQGSMLELSWNGSRQVQLAEGLTRTFLEDGDVVTLSGHCQGEGYRVGFGECTGVVLPAHPH